jgi:hypothetical protein
MFPLKIDLIVSIDKKRSMEIKGVLMKTRFWTWLFVALVLMLLPTLAGCGSDDADAQYQNLGQHTLGPGNQMDFSHYLATGS